MLSNIKTKDQRGFTLVELLIVIVVIAILAAISYVAYTGFQNRAKSSTAQSLASQVKTKVEAYNTAESAYPTYDQLVNNTGDNTTGNPDVAKLDDPALVSDTAPANEKTVQYVKCTAGAQLVWYDAQTSAVKYLGMGGASSSAACTPAP